MTRMPNTQEFQLNEKRPRYDLTLMVQVKTPGDVFKTLVLRECSFASEPRLIAKLNRIALRWSLSGIFDQAEFRILRLNNR